MAQRRSPSIVDCSRDVSETTGWMRRMGRKSNLSSHPSRPTIGAPPLTPAAAKVIQPAIALLTHAAFQRPGRFRSPPTTPPSTVHHVIEFRKQNAARRTREGLRLVHRDSKAQSFVPDGASLARQSYPIVVTPVAGYGVAAMKLDQTMRIAKVNLSERENARWRSYRIFGVGRQDEGSSNRRRIFGILDVRPLRRRDGATAVKHDRTVAPSQTRSRLLSGLEPRM